MKHIFLNLKRFDVPRQEGGVNGIASVRNWGSYIVEQIQDKLEPYRGKDVEFAMFFPELHILSAEGARKENSLIQIGCQSVLGQDILPGGNFGAFTTGRPAAAMQAAGCEYTIIGHCEERNYLMGILQAAGCNVSETTYEILNQRVKAAMNRGLKVLYCIGETSQEQESWKQVLGLQLEVGLKDADLSQAVVAYEPVWSIGPGKVPADRDYIAKVARFIKEKTRGIDVVYGGGLKQDITQLLASIEEIRGGLIALTRFQGEIGFYPEEYLEILNLYLS